MDVKVSEASGLGTMVDRFQIDVQEQRGRWVRGQIHHDTELSSRG
jgi:hypothetical protein